MKRFFIIMLTLFVLIALCSCQKEPAELTSDGTENGDTVAPPATDNDGKDDDEILDDVGEVIDGESSGQIPDGPDTPDEPDVPDEPDDGMGDGPTLPEDMFAPITELPKFPSEGTEEEREEFFRYYFDIAMAYCEGTDFFDGSGELEPNRARAVFTMLYDFDGVGFEIGEIGDKFTVTVPAELINAWTMTAFGKGYESQYDICYEAYTDTVNCQSKSYPGEGISLFGEYEYSHWEESFGEYYVYFRCITDRNGESADYYVVMGMMEFDGEFMISSLCRKYSENETLENVCDGIFSDLAVLGYFDERESIELSELVCVFPFEGYTDCRELIETDSEGNNTYFYKLPIFTVSQWAMQNFGVELGYTDGAAEYGGALFEWGVESGALTVTYFEGENRPESDIRLEYVTELDDEDRISVICNRFEGDSTVPVGVDEVGITLGNGYPTVLYYNKIS